MILYVTLISPKTKVNSWHQPYSNGTYLLLKQKLHTTKKNPTIYQTFFSADHELCHCNNISGLFESTGTSYDLHDRRLFLEGSKESTKVVLLHNGNILPSVLVTYSTTIKEN